MAVPLETWQVGPDNRWAYVHVDEVVPTQVVARGDGPATLLRDAPDERLIGLADDLPEADGVIVVRDGAVLLERFGGEMGPDSLHLSQSVGKSVLGLLVGTLVADGLLDVEASVTELVPEVAGSGYAGARVTHLLDMVAATSFVEDYAVDFWRYDVACAWHPPVEGADAETILEYLPTIGPADGWAHGERFHYATPNTDLLGLVAERAGGAPLAQLLADRLWGPLGAEADALVTVDHAGTGTIGGGFCATLRDYARLAALVAEGGRGIVPADWIDQLGHGSADAWARPVDPDIGAGCEGYARQWWRRDGAPTCRGIHGQLVVADRDTGVAIVVLSSWPAATDSARDAAQRAFVGAMRGALS